MWSSKDRPRRSSLDGTAVAPWLAWGPYLWADGLNPRAADGLIWVRDDFEQDGTHPAPSGEDKVADLLMGFLATEPTALPWFAPQPDTTLMVLPPTADAAADSAQPSTTSATEELLSLGSLTAPSTVYLQFDVSGITQPILIAKLTLRAGPDGDRDSIDTGVVSVVEDAAWNETTLSFNTAPAVGAAIAILSPYSRSSAIDVDVTEEVLNDEDGLISFAVDTTGQQGGQIQSRESEYPPQLVLTVATSAE